MVDNWRHPCCGEHHLSHGGVWSDLKYITDDARSPGSINDSGSKGSTPGSLERSGYARAQVRQSAGCSPVDPVLKVICRASP